ncbi:hypothetical protein IFR05_004937 [Cadophora sp. M221]|nr:hypothetical protein IFR05_004937 [Cadophora sp. M221]
MKAVLALLSLAASISAIAVPAPLHIDISISHSPAKILTSAPSTSEQCNPFYGEKCIPGDDKLDCCGPLSCVEDDSPDKVMRCMEPDADDWQTPINSLLDLDLDLDKQDDKCIPLLGKQC